MSRAAARLLATSGLVVALAGCGAADPPAADPPAAPPPATRAAAAPQRSGSFDPAPVREPVDSGAGPRSAQTAPPAAAANALPGRGAFIPRQLRLPSGRSVEVLPQGTRTDGELEVPPDPAVVGWWSGGSRPGDPYGSTVLAGHIDSRAYGIGALAEVATASPGATLRLGDGASGASYRITRVTRVDKDRLVTGTDAFDRTGPPRLVLITCGGAYDPRTHHYADNVVVTADPIAG